MPELLINPQLAEYWQETLITAGIVIAGYVLSWVLSLERR